MNAALGERLGTALGTGAGSCDLAVLIDRPKSHRHVLLASASRLPYRAGIRTPPGRCLSGPCAGSAPRTWNAGIWRCECARHGEHRAGDGVLRDGHITRCSAEDRVTGSDVDLADGNLRQPQARAAYRWMRAKPTGVHDHAAGGRVDVPSGDRRRTSASCSAPTPASATSPPCR